MGLIGLTRCQGYTPGSTVGRVVYHSMAAAAGAAVDVSTDILAAYQQQQQHSMAMWNLIMDGYDDDTELEAENDESTWEIKRRRVYQRKAYKTSGWWQELQDEDLSDHTSRAARRFRGDFRVPYCLFKELVAPVKKRDWFPTTKKDAVGRACEAVYGLLSLSADDLLCVWSVWWCLLKQPRVQLGCPTARAPFDFQKY